MLYIHIALVGCLDSIAKRLILINQLLDELHDFPIILRFLAPSKGIQLNLDSGFHAVDSGFQVLDSGFQSLIGFEIPDFWIPLHEAIGLR